MSEQQKSARGKFLTPVALEDAQSKLVEMGIAPEKITVETENFKPRLPLDNTQALSNLKFGAIAGGVFGALIGLFVSLFKAGFFNMGLDAFSYFKWIHYLAPVIGAIVGSAFVSLVAGISGLSAPKSDNDSQEQPLTKRYWLVVQGTEDEMRLAQEIFSQSIQS